METTIGNQNINYRLLTIHSLLQTHCLVISSSDPLSPIKNYNSLIMKTFKITYIKKNKFSIGSKPSGPVILSELIIKTDADTIDIPCPIDFEIMTVTEIQPDIIINKKLN
jgi:hypothetical protein